MFSLDSDSHALVIESSTVQMLLVGPEMIPYFKCNDAAKVLGYINRVYYQLNGPIPCLAFRAHDKTHFW